MAGYTSVTIGNAKPIEGSVNISVDDGGVETTKLKYEGGEVAKTKITTGDVTVTMEWKTPGASKASVTDESSSGITLSTNNSGETITVKGTYIKSPGWDSNWGVVTNHKIIGSAS